MSLTKKSNFHRRLLPLWSAHVCAVLPGFHWPLRRFAWNNGKLLTQGSLLNGARRLHHCDVIASLAPRAQQSWHSKPNVIHGNSLGLNTSCVLHMDWKHDIKPAGQLMSFIWYHPCDCSYSSMEGVKMLNRFPATRWPRRHVQWEQCGTNFGGKIANLRVSCYNGNNDRYARVLFVQHPREQGEWLCQKPRVSFTLLPQVLDEQHPCRPVVIP